MSPADWAVLALPGLVWGASFYFIAEGLEAFRTKRMPAYRDPK